MISSEIESTKKLSYRIGVDVGGTNTDAVLLSLSPDRVIASHKASTTMDVTSGITEAIRAVLDTSTVPVEDISCVIIGTTHFVNAVVQRSPVLRRVGAVRLCGGENGFGVGVPPFIDFPKTLRDLLMGPTFHCNGGYQISGTEISPLNTDELERAAAQLIAENIFDVVVSGVYSPLKSAHEEEAGRVIFEQLRKHCLDSKPLIQPRVTLSHSVSAIGFLARENAAILNASLRPFASQTIAGIQTAMTEVLGDCSRPTYLTQNDGSVMSFSDAVELPIRTFNSGPTNSIRGGEFLWNTTGEGQHEQSRVTRGDLVVIDIGGTTSDSGLLLPDGVPRMSSLTSLVGGVRTNFALPAVESIGLGGGSVVEVSANGVAVGPRSVALELKTKALLFGGDVLTATDIVAISQDSSKTHNLSIPSLGRPEQLNTIPRKVVEEAKEAMRHMIEDLVDRTKIQAGDIDVLVVGGGSILVDTNQTYVGVRAMKKVKGGEVANAVGAAISRVSGVVDTVVDISHQTLKEAQEQISKVAMDIAVRNGAKEGTTEVAEVTVLPIQYVDSKARICVKALGTLDSKLSSPNSRIANVVVPETLEQKVNTLPQQLPTFSEDTQAKPLSDYTPAIKNREWAISIQDLEWIAAGCKILGCGGGGDPYEQYLKLKTMLEKHPGAVKVVSATDLPSHAMIGFTSGIGSPEVSMERMDADECSKAHTELTRVTGMRPVDGFMAVEIGGANGLVNLEVAAQLGVVCVDADWMGRAYPTYWQTTLNVYGTARGEALVPATLASGDGSFITMTCSRTDKLVDKMLRAVTVEMGCGAGKAGPPQTAASVQQQAVTNTLSLAWSIGRAIALEKSVGERAKQIIQVFGGSKSGKILAWGKIINVERVLKTGHTYGVVEIDGIMSEDSLPGVIRVPFKNENAYVEALPRSADGKIAPVRILASVPDLIAVLDDETGAGLGTPDYKYGLKVTIIAIAASPRWTDTPRGLELGGPGSMGFDEVPYVPVGVYSQPKSVIDLYSDNTAV